MSIRAQKMRMYNITVMSQLKRDLEKFANYFEKYEKVKMSPRIAQGEYQKMINQMLNLVYFRLKGESKGESQT